MLDFKWIENNSQVLDRALQSRGLPCQGDILVELIQRRRALDTNLQAMRQKRNVLSEGAAGAGADDARRKEAAALREAIGQGEEAYKTLSDDLDARVAFLPNVPLADVPFGKDEQNNVTVHTWGAPPAFSFEPLEHFELGEKLGLMNFETAARLSGSRFVILKGKLAQLERALVHFMLSVHTQEFGYVEVAPPLLVHSACMFGTAQLPKFANDQFQTNNDLWLIPTAEVPLTNLARETILSEKDLPLRWVAATPCFRLEAGASGKDTRGMLRQHQFSKVELVSIVAPEAGLSEHERLLTCAQAILEKLGLPYRVVILCTGDLGFSAAKTYDLEVWMPAQKTYREISSCSLCTDFQARRMKTRMRRADGTICCPYTLNGSGLAVGRTLIAIMENYQQPDGSIHIPEPLQPFMGCTHISLTS